MTNLTSEQDKKSLNFIEQIVETDLQQGLNDGRIQTRFPPEPNGYLHIGHAKAICLDFGIAQKYKGICNLRFDDTNPVKEDVEYVDSIKEDIEWLGFRWANVYYASDYFKQLHDLAIRFIKDGKAYVDEQTSEEIAKQKGTPTTAGTDSPFRNRSVEENLDLFEKMTKGEVADGKMVLRAKIDMAHPNMHFRDPIMYRIITSHPHHRTGYQWKVYPMYDFAHGQSDYFEGVTHSLCTLEFEVHRPLYDWYIDQFADSSYRPKQREFNRLNLTYTVMSKRKLLQLVEEGLVSGWDDPRMPTLCGLRRRGYTPKAIRDFVDKIGYTKFEALNDISLLESAVRDDLNKTAQRVAAILNPIKVTITNYPEGTTEPLLAENNPEDPNAGMRRIEFSRNIYIERDDFMENPPKDYFRLSLGKEVRLKNAYIIKCTDIVKDENGNVVEILCTYDPDTKSGMPQANRKVKGTLHWVSAHNCIDAEVRLYDRLFVVENPSDDERDFRSLINPDSKKVMTGCKLEPCLRDAKPMDKFQFIRLGYFCVDKDSKEGALIVNRTATLKDGWKKK
ncbi:glutamate--tRNA ligase [Porphyromonadaceae bacterium COT-184 OH4590]|nr:glutamate--tRNA ligase [Porphyromonadaceae bacterium COT-184 OH4590]MDO4726990.1 glutamine--tRNA ligase/YqeY domain fusion protein [Porphyromonadaceae bacterium]